jgi:hypothetical protein
LEGSLLVFTKISWEDCKQKFFSQEFYKSVAIIFENKVYFEGNWAPSRNQKLFKQN